MSDPIITCPNCKTEIKLNESLAAPMIEATKKQYEQKLIDKDLEVQKRENNLATKEKQVLEEKKKINEQIINQVEIQLKAERSRIIEEEVRKAKNATAFELENKSREIADLNHVLKTNELKLMEAQKAQAELIKKERELDDEKRELELNIEKRVQSGLSEVRTKAKQEAEESLKLKLDEKDQTILSMQKTVEELKRKADQGSQQLQGEVQELELENLLKAKFPSDLIEPVAKGESGADTLQRVINFGGQASGSILWESKRTKSWQDAWLAKLRDDKRNAKADIAIIITQVLPKDVQNFGCIDGVWISSPILAIPLATALRYTLIEVNMARQISEGQQTKEEMIYQYLTSVKFRHRVEAIVEAFSSMKEDLDKERKIIMKQWAKREEQISRVIGSTVGMYGDLQGIVGKSLQEIEGLEIIEVSNSPESKTMLD